MYRKPNAAALAAIGPLQDRFSGFHTNTAMFKSPSLSFEIWRMDNLEERLAEEVRKHANLYSKKLLSINSHFRVSGALESSVLWCCIELHYCVQATAGPLRCVSGFSDY